MPDSKPKRPRITFAKEGGFRVKGYTVKRSGQVVARIAYAKQNGRWYWYAVNRHPGESPVNSLHNANSATTVEGCKQEIKEFFQSN